MTCIEVVWHVMAFYGDIFPMMERMPQPKQMTTKSKYERILVVLTLHWNAESLVNQKRADQKQIHYWHKTYAVVVAGENNESQVLVSRPKIPIGVVNIPLDNVQQIGYIEKVFSDLLVILGDNHSKEQTLHGPMGKVYANVSCLFCKAFTDTCPGCIMEQQHLCPMAGLSPVVTEGLGNHGQVDLIIF